MTIEEFKKQKPPNVEEYDYPIIVNPNPTQEQIDAAKKLFEKYEGIKILKSEKKIKFEEYLKSNDKIKINHFISLPISALIEVVCHFFVKE